MFRNTLAWVLTFSALAMSRPAAANDYANTVRFDFESAFARYNKDLKNDQKHVSAGLYGLLASPMYVVNNRLAVGGSVHVLFSQSKSTNHTSRNRVLGIGPRVEWTMVERGAVRPFVLVGGWVSRSWSLYQSTNGDITERAKERGWSLGSMGGIGLRFFASDRVSIDPWVSLSYDVSQFSNNFPKSRRITIAFNARVAVWGRPKTEI